MSDQKQIKELSFSDLFLSGVSLVAVSIIFGGIKYKGTSDFFGSLINDDITTEAELADFHDVISSNYYYNLVCVGLLWLAAILSIIHVSYINGIMESLYTSMLYINIDNHTQFITRTKYCYIFSFIIIITVGLIVGGILLFLLSYYDWEFEQASDATFPYDVSYVGYYIQLLLIRGCIECYNCSLIFVAIVATVPWVSIMFGTKYGIKLYCFDIRLCGNRFCVLLVVPVCVVFTYISVAFGLLNWEDYYTLDDSHFWSVNGASYYISYFSIIILLINGVWLTILSCKMKSVNRLIDNVNKDAFSKWNYDEANAQSNSKTMNRNEYRNYNSVVG